jgi:hypothetical protein
MTQPDFGNGIEVGRFRLKPGVGEATMRSAYEAMVAVHLKVQPGWRRQLLVKLDDVTFLDLAYADDRAASERICAAWRGFAGCDAFLALIEPLDMSFGTILCDVR